MLSIFAVSFFSVLKIFLVCLCGAWLSRRGVFTKEFRQQLSQVILWLMLPCLLVSKLSVSVNPANLKAWSALPLTALVYIGLGFTFGGIAMLLVRPPADERRVLTAACTFGNSGYIPFPLVIALASTAPIFANDPEAAGRGIAYISVYLVAMSPCLWGIGFPFLSGRPVRSLRWQQILSPPVISILVSIALGTIPPLRSLVVETGAPLRILLDSASLIGQAAIPCALFLVGASLADIRMSNEGAALPTLGALFWVRQILMPLAGVLITVTLWRLRLIPHDPMCALVLMIQASVPPATNLVVMCQVHNRGTQAMSHLILVTYLAAVPMLTIWIAFFLWVVGNL
ncbi:MAG: AEC family transporter [Lentisphaeria bacterium]|nr:AEC family transporter [Lentisphaeria bacterium]